jgi:diguanylate cyclase (GGDEF)-like protein
LEAPRGDDGPDLSPILETAAIVLETERTSFWRYEDEGRTMRCEHLYLRGASRHLSSKGALPVLVNPQGFEVPSEARVTLAREASKDEPTSMLDAPVRLSGAVVGLVRYEHHLGERPRDFSPEDLLFAASIADLVALALESAQRAQPEERVGHVSLHDPLTDLPNRRLFLERVERSLRGLERRSGLVAVLSLDVDDFGKVNERVGRAGADEVLVAIARAITGVLRPADLPARLEGDAFGVLIDRLDEPWEAIAVAERVQQALGRASPPGQGPALPTASIGVALSDGSRAISAAELLREADVALARAREGGGGRYEVFASAMRREVLERMSLGWALRDALQAGQLALES